MFVHVLSVRAGHVLKVTLARLLYIVLVLGRVSNQWATSECQRHMSNDACATSREQRHMSVTFASWAQARRNSRRNSNRTDKFAVFRAMPPRGGASKPRGRGGRGRGRKAECTTQDAPCDDEEDLVVEVVAPSAPGSLKEMFGAQNEHSVAKGKQIFAEVIAGGSSDLADASTVDGEEFLMCSPCGMERPSSELHPYGTSGKQECKKCAALRNRIARMKSKNTELATNWATVPDDAKRSFMSEFCDLKGHALAEQMEMTVEFHKVNTSTVFTGAKGEERPISWYRTNGYDEEACTNIMNNVPGRMCPNIGQMVYSLSIVQSGHTDSEATISKAVFTPKAQGSRKLERNPSGGSDKSKDQGVGSNDGGKAATKRKDKPKASTSNAEKPSPKKKSKTVNQAMNAKRILGLVGPLQISMAHNLNDRLPRVQQEKVPSYLVNESRKGLARVKDMLDLWTSVLNKTNDAPPDGGKDSYKSCVDELAAIAKANTSLSTVIDIASSSE